ncbi:MAG: hypothetical protein ABGX22_21870 [Pirellulaceae bacterium]|nr:hypothetical protein [Planctomycetaceae bacterium]
MNSKCAEESPKAIVAAAIAVNAKRNRRRPPTISASMPLISFPAKAPPAPHPSNAPKLASSMPKDGSSTRSGAATLIEVRHRINAA